MFPMRSLRQQDDQEREQQQRQRDRLLINVNSTSPPTVTDGMLESAHSYDSINPDGGPGRTLVLASQQHQQSDRHKQKLSRKLRQNAIRNQKYSILTFVPLVFYEQASH